MMILSLCWRTGRDSNSCLLFLYIFGIILAMISIFGNILRDFGLGFLVNSLFHLSINGYSNSSLYLVLISSLVMIEGIFLQNWSKLWTFKA